MNFKSILALWVFIISFASSGLQAQPKSFTLQQAQDYAVKNSYTSKSAAYDVQIARKKVIETLAQGLPQIDASLDYNYNILLPTSLIPNAFFKGDTSGGYTRIQFGTKNTATLGATLNQLIFDGRYFIGLQYSKIYKQLADESYEKSGLDVKEMVTNTYSAILVGEEALRIVDSTISVLNKIHAETEQMYKEGFAEESELDQMTLNLSDAENSYNQLKSQNDITYNLLKFQMGIAQEEDITLSESLDDLISNASSEALAGQSFNLKAHIDYRMADTQEAMKMLSIKNEQASFLPVLKGFIYLNTNAQRDKFSFFDTKEIWFPSSALGVKMSVPIFSSGMRHSRLSQARIDLEKARNTKSQVEQSLLLGVSQAKSQYITALQNYMRDKNSVDLALKIYHKTTVKYEEGIVSSVELTQQHNQFLSTESKYFQTILSLLNAKNKLDKALGNY